MKTGLGVGVALLVGCAPAVTSEFRGEPLYTLHGTIDNKLRALPPPLELVIAWRRGPAVQDVDPERVPDERIVIQTKSEVTGEFPALFRLRLFEPPPDEILLRADDLLAQAPLKNAIGDGALAVGMVLVVDKARPPELDDRQLTAALEDGGPLPAGVYGVSTSTAYYSAGFAIDEGLPSGLVQEEPGFIVVEPLQGVRARTWQAFAAFRRRIADDGYAGRWEACVRACVSDDSSADDDWLDSRGCADGEAPMAQAACLECEAECAAEHGLESLEGYAAARAACDDACAIERPGDDACALACRALDPIVLNRFPGDAVIIGPDELLTVTLSGA